jgi:hypothetical protein
MKALHAIRQSSYGPERLKLIYQAFDDAWAAIKPLVDDNPLAQEAARLALANTILSIAGSDGAYRRVAKPDEAPVAHLGEKSG